MVEYIDREDAIRMLRGSAIAKYPLSFFFGIFASADELEKLPAADVAQVRHGRWEYSFDCGLSECSACGWNIEEYVEDYAFCPNCGAKMDLRRDDDGT